VQNAGLAIFAVAVLSAIIALIAWFPSSGRRRAAKAIRCRPEKTNKYEGSSKYEEAELAVETPKPAIPELENERKERAAALEANAAQPREIEGNHRFELADSRSVGPEFGLE